MTPGLFPRGTGAAAALLAALAGAPLAAQDTVAVPAVTLGEAVQRALAVDPAAVASAEGIRAAGAQQMLARGAWLPSVGVTSGYTNSSSERFDQATGRLVSESYTAQLNAGYDLFTGGRRFADARSAGARRRAAEAGYVEQRFTTALAVKEEFYGAVAAEELLTAARARVARAEQGLVFARTRLELGSATRSDLLRAELERGRAELAVVDAEAALRAARLRLGRRVGAEGPVQPASARLPEEAPALPPAAELAARAEAAAPSVRAARALVDQRRAEVSAAQTAYLPTVRATAGLDWQNVEFPPDDRRWNVRLTAALPLFNGFQREAGVAGSRVQRRIAQAQAEDAVREARVAAATAAQDVATAERRVAIARRAVELAQEDLRVVEERYRLGNATILELQTSQEALAVAESDWVRERQGLAVAVARLEAVLGEDLDPADGAALTPR